MGPGYFHSKSDLVAALRRRFAEDLVKAVAAQPATKSQGDWFGILQRRLDTTADAFWAQGQRHEVLFHGDAEHHGGGGEAQWAEEIVGALTELIRAGSAAGAFAVVDPELTAVALFHAVYGLFHHGLHGAEGPERERLLAAAWDLVWRALVPITPVAPESPSEATRRENVR